METISPVEARRLALARAGLIKPEWTAFPRSAGGDSVRSRKAAVGVIRRFGYLQLDTVSVAGARSHAIVLLSRLNGFVPRLAEDLLAPQAPIFEYWGHETSWMPIELYPFFEFRRKAFRRHPWWGDLLGQHPRIANELRRQIRAEGPMRSIEMKGSGGKGWWNLKTRKKVAEALWASGELAIRERRNFQRVYDLAERVIPEKWRRCGLEKAEAIERLLLLALEGHGWATTGTLTQTWRLKNMQASIAGALKRLSEKGEIAGCDLINKDGSKTSGWIRPADLQVAGRLKRVRPRRDTGVLLSPFDPILWDRRRVKLLFNFDQVLEIYKPASERRYGYYCLPVLAGENLVARIDLKAEIGRKRLQVLSCHYEAENQSGPRPSADREAVRVALQRYADSLGLETFHR